MGRPQPPQVTEITAGRRLDFLCCLRCGGSIRILGRRAGSGFSAGSHDSDNTRAGGSMANNRGASGDLLRRSFLKTASLGFTGGLLASGSRLCAKPFAAQENSLRIVKVEPQLLAGVRGYGPWLFVRVETEEGIVRWGEGTNFPGVQPIATAVRNLRGVVVGESAWNIEKLWNRMYRFLYYNGMGGVVLAAISGIDTA